MMRLNKDLHEAGELVSAEGLSLPNAQEALDELHTQSPNVPEDPNQNQLSLGREGQQAVQVQGTNVCKTAGF